MEMHSSSLHLGRTGAAGEHRLCLYSCRDLGRAAPGTRGKASNHYPQLPSPPWEDREGKERQGTLKFISPETSISTLNPSLPPQILHLRTDVLL